MYQKKIDRIIVHHTWSKDNPIRYDWDAIKKYHLSRGWDDIGYHYGIEQAEKEYKVVRGRPDYVIGAHCLRKNKSSLGIAVVGNFNETEPPKEVYTILAKLCCAKIHKHPGIIAIEPHSKYSKKTCPGKLFDMPKLLDLVEYYRKGLPNE